MRAISMQLLPADGSTCARKRRTKLQVIDAKFGVNVVKVLGSVRSRSPTFASGCGEGASYFTLTTQFGPNDLLVLHRMRSAHGA